MEHHRPDRLDEADGRSNCGLRLAGDAQRCQLGSGAFDSTTIMDSTTLRAAITDLLATRPTTCASTVTAGGQLYYATYLTLTWARWRWNRWITGMVVDRRFAAAAGPVSSAAWATSSA